MNDSLRTAFTNLLDRYSLPGDKVHLSDTADWHTITSIDPRITVVEVGANNWPHTNDAIVKFQIQSADQPYTDVDGFQRANMLDSYCLMADVTQRLCVAADGGIEEIPNSYGKPVAWASYNVDAKHKPADPGRLYKMVKGDTVWSIAQRFKIPAKELMEHNDIEDSSTVSEHTILHLPIPKDLSEERSIIYEILPKPLPMHVNKDNGTRKWSFGNIKKWDDFTASGFFPKHTNLTIVALAHVPVGAEDTAAYYMDALALGDYATTGRVAYTVGFAWSDLTEGFMVAHKPAPPAKQPLAQNVVTDIKFEQKKKKIEKIADDPTKNHDLWKTTYQKLEQPESVTADLPEGQDVITIKDYDGHRPDKNMPWDWEGYIAGTFVVDDILYGRPLGSTINLKEDPNWTPNWYGIPMECLTSNKDLYTDGTDRRLTLAERKLWAPVFQRAVRVSEKYTNLKHKKTK